MTPAKDMREPKDKHTTEHLNGVRHKLLSDPPNVRRQGPIPDNQFDRQEKCYRPKGPL